MAHRSTLSLAALSAAAVLSACTPPVASDACSRVTCPAGERCRPSDGECVALPCGEECTGATPLCDEGRAKCVACLARDDCDATAPFCDGAGRCVSCLDASHCGGETPVCDPAAGACVRCIEGLGCDGARPFCDTSVPRGRCVACIGSEQCSGDTPFCQRATGECVACLADGHCDPGAPVCDPAAFSCVTCTQVRGCSGETPVCDPSVPGGRCVRCTGPSHCDGERPVCDASGTCVACLGHDDCPADAPICDTGGGRPRCVECTEGGGECGAAGLCAFGTCVEPGADCASAPLLALPGEGTISFTVDTTGARNELDASCNGALPGPERVFRVRVDAPSDLVVTAARAAGSSVNPVLSARTAGCRSGAELACSESLVSAAAVERVSLSAFEGELELVVESAGPVAGRVDVTIVATRAATPYPGDECVSAVPLVFDAHGEATFSGDTHQATGSNGAGDGSARCSVAGVAGPDLVFTYTLEEPQDVEVLVHSNDPGAVVYVRGDGRCSSGAALDEAACAIANSRGHASFDLNRQPSGTWSLWVDSSRADGGRFDGTVRRWPASSLPPANDDCDGAQRLTFSEGVAHASLNTLAATNSNAATDDSPSCAAVARESGADVVYAFTLAAPQDVTIRVTPSSLTPEQLPVVYLRPLADCANGERSREIACSSTNDMQRVETTVRGLAPGDYALFVDTRVEGGAGRFTLDVLLSPPAAVAPHDACASAGVLALDEQGRALASGDTTSAFNDDAAGSGPSCSDGARAIGRDVFFEYTLETPGDVALTLAPPAGSYPRAVLAVGDTCDSSVGAERACAVAAADGKVVGTVLRDQPAGTYRVQVDGEDGSAGKFLLGLETRPPANDSCAQPRVLPLSTGASDLTQLGHTAFASDDFSRANASATCLAQRNFTLAGRDVVFAYTEPVGGHRTVTVAPSADLDVVVARLQGTCEPGSCVALTDHSPRGGTETLSFSAVAGATYWFVVDGYSADDVGAFSIRIR